MQVLFTVIMKSRPWSTISDIIKSLVGLPTQGFVTYHTHICVLFSGGGIWTAIFTVVYRLGAYPETIPQPQPFALLNILPASEGVHVPV